MKLMVGRRVQMTDSRYNDILCVTIFYLLYSVVTAYQHRVAQHVIKINQTVCSIFSIYFCPQFHILWGGLIEYQAIQWTKEGVFHVAPIGVTWNFGLVHYTELFEGSNKSSIQVDRPTEKIVKFQVFLV